MSAKKRRVHGGARSLFCRSRVFARDVDRNRSCLSGRHGYAALGQGAFEVPVDHADDDRALADGRRHPFQPEPDVPDREHPGKARFERERRASQSHIERHRPGRRSWPVMTYPASSRAISGGSHSVCGRAPIWTKSAAAETVSVRPEEASWRTRRSSRPSATVDDPGVQSDVDVLRGLDVFHEVVRHTLGE